METTIVKRGRPNVLKDDAPNILKQLRVKAGLTQKQLAQIIGVKVSTYSNAENYGRSLGKAGWYKLADFYNIDPRILEGRKKISPESLPIG